MTRKKILIVSVGAVLVLVSGLAYALSSSVSWTPMELKPASIAPGQSMSYTLTLKHTGILPITPTNQLRIVAEGDIAPFVTLTQPTFPPSFKRGNEVTVGVAVAVPSAMPLSVKTGRLVLQRVLPNGTVKEVWNTDALPVELTFSPFHLPPVPNKEEDEATIEGVDADENGVPDRVDRWIGFTAPDSQKKRAAMTLSAKSQQDFFKDYLAHLGEDQNTESVRTRVRAMAISRSKTDNCRRYVFGATTLDAEDDVAMEAVGKNIRELNAWFMDTPERARTFWESERPLVAWGPPNVQPTQYRQECLDLGLNADALPN